MSGDITPYLGLVTSEHASQPNFVATLTATLQPVADQFAVVEQITNAFNLDTAVGQQLDFLGQWIGPSRYLQVPITGVFFSFDTSGVGFDQGVWEGPYDTGTQLTQLDDATYRLLLYSTVAANHWHGDIPGALILLNQFWNPLGWNVYLFDGQDMTMSIALVGPPLNALQYALYSGGYLDVRPAGVTVIAHYYIPGTSPGPGLPPVPTNPIFGFDEQNLVIAGFDTGYWAGNTVPLVQGYNPPGGGSLVLNFSGLYAPPAGGSLILNFH